MSALELKNDLLKLIINTDDFYKLKSLKDYFKQLEEEEVVSKREEELIDIGLRESEEGKLISREEVKSRIDKILKK